MRSMRSRDSRSLRPSSSPGWFYGPEAERGRFDGVSWGVLAGYLFGAFLLVLTNRHD